MRIGFSAVLLTAILISGNSYAQVTEFTFLEREINKDEIKGKGLINELGLDLSAPTSPVLAVLDLTPESVIRPTTPRKFSASVLNGVDPRGNQQNGFALDFNPFSSVKGNSLSINQYQFGVDDDATLKKQLADQLETERKNNDTSLIDLLKEIAGKKLRAENPNITDTDLAAKLQSLSHEEQLAAFKQDRRDSYRGNRLASRVSLSAAFVRGAGDDDAERAAFGFTLTPWDRGDSTNDGQQLNCLQRTNFDKNNPNDSVGKKIYITAKDTWEKVIGVQHKAEPDENKKKVIRDKFVKGIKEQIGEARSECRKTSAAKSWNASAWNIGVAGAWINTPNNSEDYQFGGLGIWSTFSYGFDDIAGFKPFEVFDFTKGLKDSAQLLAHVKYRTNEKAPIPTMEDMFLDQDTLTAAVQFRVNGPDVMSGDAERVGGPDFNFSFEGAYIMERRQNFQNEETFRYTLSAEYKLQEDTYLKISAGTESGRSLGTNETFITSNIKFALGGEPTK